MKEGWRSLEHTVSPLTTATPPKTVKMFRSWLGAAKQVSQCIKNYAIIFYPLEAAAASELKDKFEAVKKAVRDVETVQLPHPDDTLNCFSD